MSANEHSGSDIRERFPFSGLLFDSLTSGIVFQNPDGQITDANPAAERILGLSLDQMRGVTSIDPKWHAVREDGSAFPGEEHPSMLALRSGEPVLDVLMGVFNPNHEGQTWIKIRAFPIKDESGGPPQGVYTLFEDIASLRQIQVEKQRVDRALRLLSDCNLSLVRAKDERTLLHDVCTLVVRAGGYRMAWIGFADQGEGKPVRPVAWYGFEAGYLEQTRFSWDEHLEIGRGPTGTAIRTGLTQTNGDFLANPKLTPWRDDAVSRGYQSSIALPLVVEQQTIGALMLYAPEPDAFQSQEVTLLEELARNLAFGLEAVRTRSQRELAEVQLAEAQHVARLGSWYWDANSGSQVVSAEMREIFGRKDIPPLQEQCDTLYSREAWNRLRASTQDALRTGTGFDLELPAMQGDGARIWINARSVAVRDASGVVTGLRGTVQDITERKRNAEQYRTIIQASLDGFWITDRQARILDVNESSCRMLGYTREELLCLSITHIEADESPEDTAAHIREVMERGHVQFEARHRRKDGIIINVEVSVLYVADLGERFFAFVRDITASKRAEKELRIAAIAFDTQEGIIVTDAAGTIVRVNKAFTELTGYRADEVLGKNPSILQSGRHNRKFYEQLWSTLLTSQYWQGEIWNRRKNDEIFPEWLTISAVSDAHGIVTQYVGIFTDMTERMAAQDQIRNLAYYDSLTQLPNRRLLFDRLAVALPASARRGNFGAIVFLDLDNFKNLNDTKGHETGDRLLVEVATRLRASVRAEDTVARLGGDEFVVVFENIGDERQEAIVHARQLAHKVQQALAATYTLGDLHYESTASIGLALFQGSGETIDELIRQADVAMYQAKSSGRNAIHLFQP